MAVFWGLGCSSVLAQAASSRRPAFDGPAWPTNWLVQTQAAPHFPLSVQPLFGRNVLPGSGTNWGAKAGLLAGTNGFSGQKGPAWESPPLPPGIYQTYPYSCLVLVPGPHPDDKSIANLQGGQSQMPIVQPGLTFVPKNLGSN